MREDMGINAAWGQTKSPAQRSPLAERLMTLLRGAARPQPRLLRHIETLSLGGKRSLHLVECDGQRFLITAGADCLSAPVPLPQPSAARSEPGDGS